MSCTSSEKDKQNIDINNGITLLTVKDYKELNRSNSLFGKRAKRTLIKEIKSTKSNNSSMSSTDSQKPRQTKRKISAKSSSSKLPNQKHLVTNMPDTAKASTSSRKQKGQFGNKHKKPISSTELPVTKLHKISRNVSHSAKQKITKSTKVPQSKPCRLQFSSTLKPQMREGNLFLSEEFNSISDQGTMPQKSTRVSMNSGKKVKLQSSKKSLSFVAGGDESSQNAGSKFQKVSKKTKQKQATPSKLSGQSSAMKLRSKSKPNVSTELQHKRKPVKDSSVQRSEAKVENISQSSKSVPTKKRKAESDDPSGNLVTRQLRSMGKKRK